MKRRKRITQKKKKKYICDACGSISQSLDEYKNHISVNPECRKKLPYCCQFCTYVGCDQSQFEKNMLRRPVCNQFYLEKEVTTGQILDLSLGQLPLNVASPNKTSYEFKNISFSGMQTKTQLNLTDKTMSNMCYDKQIDLLNHTKDKARKLSTYMNTGRIISSITNESIPFEYCLQRNNNDSDCDESEPNDNNSENADIILDDVAIYNDNNRETLTVNDSVVDITKEQNDMVKRFSSMKFTHSDEASMDLFHIMKSSNVPLVMFDRIIRWLKRHEGTIASIGTSGFLCRKQFIESMNKKMYDGPASIMKPKVCKTVLSSGRTSNFLSFSMREMILKMVTNKTLFHPGNLLLDPKNPCGDIADDGCYGDVNTGTWYQTAKKHECTLPNHILMPFCHFIDGLSVDKYGKLSVEAVLTCCLWYNRKARNRSSSWWVHGFVEDQALFMNQKSYSKQEKLQDYHDMMSKIYLEMKQIRDCGGIKLTLNFGNDGKHEVIAIPVIQYIIGDCKGNDTLCGRKGGHSLQMNGLCRDCNIHPSEGDNTCINEPLLCRYITKGDIEGKTKDELDAFHFIQ